MKRLGLIGGVSPESTEIYVRLLNRDARRRLGGEHSANFIVWHLDYGEMIALYRARDWARFVEAVAEAGEGLVRAGAEGLMICSNTTHIAAETLAERTRAPVIHIQDALARALRARGAQAPLLLGTKATMADDFYRASLARRFKGAVATPPADAQDEIERIILDELCFGVVKDASRRTLLEIIDAEKSADAVILGCTELSLIAKEGDCAPPVFDTTLLHAAAGAAFAFDEDA